MKKFEIREVIDAYYDELVSWRRYFHMNPETGFKEFKTSAKIIEILSQIDGVEIVKDFCETAVVAIVKGKKKGKVIGIRSDMDALPMPDLKDVSYKSKNPFACHACGHDVHTVIGLGTIKFFAQHIDEMEGTLKVIFQPAEEGPAPGGASKVVKTGIADDIDYIVGVHTNPDVPLGTVLLKKGNMLASADNFKITVKGRGGHGAYPHITVDPISCGISIYNMIQLMQTRELNPVEQFIISICSLQAGEPGTTNVIPDVFSMSGTFRTFNNDVRDQIAKRIREISESVSSVSNCSCEIEIGTVSKALANNEEVIDVLWDVCKEIKGIDNIVDVQDVEMGYDDFAYFGDKSKAAYFYIGTTNKNDLGKFTFHNSMFDVDESCLCLGVDIMVNIVKKLWK